MPFSLSWLIARLKKPDLFLFQNHKVTSRAWERLTAPRLPRYRSFWATCSVGEQAGGVCTYSRKAFPVALDTQHTQTTAHYACSHLYTPVVPLPGHALFQQPGRVVVSDHGAFVLLHVYLPPPPPRHGQRLLARQRLQAHITEYCQALRARGREVLLVGDLSFPPDCQADVDAPPETSSSMPWPAHVKHDQAWLRALQTQEGLVDCYRALHPDERSFSTSSRFVLPSLPQDVDLRTSVALSSPRFFEGHVAECFYVDFSALRYPDPRVTRSSRKSSSSSSSLPEGKKEGHGGEEGGQLASLTPVYRYLHAAHFPLVLSLTVPPLARPLPSMDDFPPGSVFHPKE